MTQMTGKPGDAAACQRVDEWTKLDAVALKYHELQWQTPKQSTKALEQFAADKLKSARRVVDLGCGAGAATAYFAATHSGVLFSGKDYVGQLIDIGNAIARERGIQNLGFQQADWYNLEEDNDFDGVLSLQTLSWLPEYQRPLAEIFAKLKPDWICLNSLFYEGEISCRVEVTEHTRSAQSFYNVYSLPEVNRFCASYGYKLTKYEPFIIDIDIPKPSNGDIMGTYTRTIQGDGEDGQRIQISGPLLLSWYMVMIERAG